jgi:hypothetical protein
MGGEIRVGKTLGNKEEVEKKREDKFGIKQINVRREKRWGRNGGTE